MSYRCEHGFVHHHNVGRCPKCTEAQILRDAATEQADHLRRLVELQTSAAKSAPPSAADERRAEFNLCVRSARKCLEIDEVEAAAQQLDQAAALLPAEPDLYEVRALLAERRGDYGAAVSAREKAFRLSGTLAHGLAYVGVLSPDAAGPVLDQLAARHPKHRVVVVAHVANRLLRGAYASPEACVDALMVTASTADELKGVMEALQGQAGGGARWEPIACALRARIGALSADEGRRAQEQEASRKRAAADAARKREAEELARVQAELDRDSAQRKKAEQEARAYAIGTVLMAPFAAVFLGLLGGLVLAPVCSLANHFADAARGPASYQEVRLNDPKHDFFEDSSCGRGCQGGFNAGAVLGSLLGIFAVVRRDG